MCICREFKDEGNLIQTIDYSGILHVQLITNYYATFEVVYALNYFKHTGHFFSAESEELFKGEICSIH